VRREFTGLLTYCSIFYPVETQQVGFWEDVDFIAMDTYVPFIANVTDPAPTYQFMLQRFDGYFSRVQQWHSSQPANVSSLPIVLSEVGYPSSLAGTYRPANDPPKKCESGTPYEANFTLQQMAFDALITVLTTKHPHIVKGMVVFWFDNPTTADYYPKRATNAWGCSWTPRGKPAECNLAKAFGGVATISNCTSMHRTRELNGAVLAAPV